MCLEYAVGSWVWFLIKLRCKVIKFYFCPLLWFYPGRQWSQNTNLLLYLASFEIPLPNTNEWVEGHTVVQRKVAEAHLDCTLPAPHPKTTPGRVTKPIARPPSILDFTKTLFSLPGQELRVSI